MDWLKYKKIYFTVSILMVVISVFSLLKWQLKLGVDFRGGTIVEYKSEKQISTEDASRKLEEQGIEVQSIQASDNDIYIFRLQAVPQEKRDLVSKTLKEEIFGEDKDVLKFETVGPSIGPELVKKTWSAIAIAAILILIWVAYQFKSFVFGVSAILAMFHDTLILVGSFSLMGHFLGTEVDFLFVTALLTTLSFSVHDTIVVFDRIREINRNFGGELEDVANTALTETMVRSLNNSFTIIFMLVALILLGGITIKWFAVALLIGTVLGTYSSPFVAVPLLIIFNKIKKSK